MFDLETYRLFSDVLLQFACGLHGRNEDDPVYQRVTEGRDVGAMRAKYSSCGDLAHWLHFRLGLRTSWINRKEHTGWRAGLNVSRLAYSAVTLNADPAHLRPVLDCGDVGIIWSLPTGTDAHVLVVRASGGGLLDTAEYGQPGGALKARTLKDGKIGTRKLQKILPLAAAIDTARSAGALQAPDKPTILEACSYLEDVVPGEILDAVTNSLARV